MKNEKLSDERTSSVKRKIYSEGFGLIMMILFVSVLIQQFIFQAPFQQYGVEFVCFFGGCYYMIIRSIFLGNTVYEIPNKKIRKYFILNASVCACTITIITVISRMKKDPVDVTFILLTALFFVIEFCVAYFVPVFVHRINKNRQNKIIDEMNNVN